MTQYNEMSCVTDEGWTVSELRECLLSRDLLVKNCTHLESDTTEGLLDEQDYRGFPIVNNAEDRILLGYIGRVELLAALGASSFASRI